MTTTVKHRVTTAGDDCVETIEDVEGTDLYVRCAEITGDGHTTVIVEVKRQGMPPWSTPLAQCADGASTESPGLVEIKRKRMVDQARADAQAISAYAQEAQKPVWGLVTDLWDELSSSVSHEPDIEGFSAYAAVRAGIEETLEGDTLDGFREVADEIETLWEHGEAVAREDQATAAWRAPGWAQPVRSIPVERDPF